MTATPANTATKADKPMAPTTDPPEPTTPSDTAAPNTAAPNTAEPAPDTAAEPTLDTTAEPGPAPPATVEAGRRLTLPRLTDRGMQGLFAMAFAGLLIFVFTDQSNKITHLDDKITRLDDKIDSLEDKVDARFAAQDEKIDEINLKLTALIAALNMSSTVDAAVEGQLADAP